MKKYFNYIIILVLFLFIGVVNVKAFNIDSITGGNTNGKTFTVKITGAKDRNAIPVLTYTEKDSISCTGDCGGTGGSSGSRSIRSNDVTLTFKINTAEYKEIKFTLTDKNGNNTTINKSYEINTNKKVVITTTAATTTQATTTSNKSKNNNLKTLEVKDEEDNVITMTPKFDPSVYEYTLEVEGKVKKVTVNTTLEDAKANMVISDNVNSELKAGETNKIIITVTAEDGSKKAYTLNIKRGALTNDATLKSLKIKELKDFKLKKDTYKYKISIKESIKKLNISYEVNDENATVKVEGNKKLKDGSVIKIIVTAQDGSKKEYKLEVSKIKEQKIKTKDYSIEKNPFIIMGLSIVAFGLIGAIIYVLKK